MSDGLAFQEELAAERQDGGLEDLLKHGPRLLELLEKQAIYENMVRYTRGIDRHDLPTMKSAYWEDSIDNHGGFVGNGHEFCEFVCSQNKTGFMRSMAHLIGNVQIELDGDEARAESVVQVVSIFNNPDGTGDRDYRAQGRYRDLYQKRHGAWKIFRRLTIYDWVRESGASEYHRWLPNNVHNLGRDYPEDPIYADWRINQFNA